MSEADRIFGNLPRSPDPQDGPERRLVPIASRRNGHRVVEVVHLRRPGAGAAAASNAGAPRRGDSGVRAASWPEGFHARPTPVLPSFPAAEPPPPPAPTVHVMPAWAPSAKPEPVVEPPAPTTRGPRVSDPLRAPRAPKAARPADAPPARRGRPPTPRVFADPFAAEDDGANCIRCGYLVEARREQRGLLTCAACG